MDATQTVTFGRLAHVLGYPVHVGRLSDLLAQVVAYVGSGKKAHVVTLNPEMIMAGEADGAFGQVLKSADVVLPDGAGVVWALKRKGIAAVRVPGIEFSEGLLAHCAQNGLAVALIGASPSVNLAVVQALKIQMSGLNVVFSHHGFFGSQEEKARVAKACAETRPWLVLVALGVPGQEFWIRQFVSFFASPCAFVGVGGSFDVWSGTKQRAHPVMRRLGLEWVYRVYKEPWRIKRLYKTLPMFVVKVLCTDGAPTKAQVSERG